MTKVVQKEPLALRDSIYGINWLYKIPLAELRAKKVEEILFGYNVFSPKLKRVEGLLEPEISDKKWFGYLQFISKEEWYKTRLNFPGLSNAIESSARNKKELVLKFLAPTLLRNLWANKWSFGNTKDWKVTMHVLGWIFSKTKSSEDIMDFIENIELTDKDWVNLLLLDNKKNLLDYTTVKFSDDKDDYKIRENIIKDSTERPKDIMELWALFVSSVELGNIRNGYQINQWTFKIIYNINGKAQERVFINGKDSAWNRVEKIVDELRELKGKKTEVAVKEEKKVVTKEKVEEKKELQDNKNTLKDIKTAVKKSKTQTEIEGAGQKGLFKDMMKKLNLDVINLEEWVDWFTFDITTNNLQLARKQRPEVKINKEAIYLITSKFKWTWADDSKSAIRVTVPKSFLMNGKWNGEDLATFQYNTASIIDEENQRAKEEWEEEDFLYADKDEVQKIYSQLK